MRSIRVYMISASSLTKYKQALTALRVPPVASRTFTQSMGLDPRDLEITDLDKGFLDILSQLTTVGDVSTRAFKERLSEVDASPDYRIVVIEDEQNHRIVATAACLIERKFVHTCGKVGHIEDVVVDQTYRGKRLGQRVIEALMEFAKGAGCYKVILDCGESNVAFYEKCGLARKEVQMARYF